MYLKALVLPALAAVVRAADNGAQYVLARATITECAALEVLTQTVDVEVLGPTCIVRYPEVFGAPIIVEVEAPQCDCGCKTCVHTFEYTTYFPAFCSTGLYEQEYVIIETYKGMEAKPTIASQAIPFGFTCDVLRCTTCGPAPITTTITYPVNGHPYINAGAQPTPIPAAPGETSGESGGPSGGQAGKGDSQNGQISGRLGSNSGSNSGGQTGDQTGSSVGGSNGGSQNGSNGGQNSGQNTVPDHGNAAPKATSSEREFKSSVRPTSGAETSDTVSPEASNVLVTVSGASRELGLAGILIAFVAVIPLIFL
ncbi:hypothetical protein NW761_008226 [Fusarium oxysporum]|nr:hypothetical protein NW758_006771 [Fusarium oxysporum]KAJ4086606.1 hypothetical protein NW761_008226 [Fusarium oxysporum]